MQLLNITTQNRPAKSLTSKPYPTYTTEPVNYGVVIHGIEKSNLYYNDMPTAYTVGIADATIRSGYVALPYGTESMKSNHTIGEIQITASSAYRTYSIGTENMKSQHTLAEIQVTMVVKYIPYNIGVESMQSHHTIAEIQITN